MVNIKKTDKGITITTISVPYIKIITIAVRTKKIRIIENRRLLKVEIKK